MQERPQIDICLATYNGELYLPQLLNSLASQNGVEINLLASDDGSSDDTVAILKANAHLFKSLSLYTGPQKGPAENFFFLFTKSSSHYTAFADQDDIWIEDHLINSISRIEKYFDSPALTFSKVYEFQDDDVQKYSIWPQVASNYNPESWFFENKARGCTIVLNEEARKLILSKPHKAAIMHDWWCILIVLTCGKVVIGEKPEILYRRHRNNFTGKSRRPRNKYSLKKIMQILGEWSVASQLKGLYQEFGDQMSGSSAKTVFISVNHLNKSRVQRILNSCSNKKKMRSSLLDEVIVRIRISLCSRNIS
jgi:glycosyltransferase involved in cell wall biosynthesis